jgi:hypothetical protein
MTPKDITKRALLLFDFAIQNNLAGTIGELCKKIGLVQSNLADIKSGKRAFTHIQLYHLAKLTKANLNWVYGFSDEMFRFVKEKAPKPTEKIRQALTEIEALMKAGKK